MRLIASLRRIVSFATLSPLCTAAAQGRLSAGDSLRVRLLDAVTSAADRSVIRAKVIAPFIRGDSVVVPTGALLTGHVEAAGRDGSTHEQWLIARFDELAIPVSDRDTTRVELRARFATLDNAREHVDSTGRIVGPPGSSLIKSRRGWLLLAVGTLHPVGAIATTAVLEAEERERHRRIDLPAGIEGAVIAEHSVDVTATPAWRSPPAFVIDSAFATALASLPRHTQVRQSGPPGDAIAIALVGSREALRSAFIGAGWDSSATMSFRTDFLTFAKAARAEGYIHQPVSTNVLEGRAPDFVFQKLANTFVKRHHVRIWRSTAAWNGEPVWLVAGSRDVGVEFSSARRTFAHLTDPRIDDEREKVINDLIAAGGVASLAYFPRSPLPGLAVNDGSAPVVTDWRLGVVRLRGRD